MLIVAGHARINGGDVRAFDTTAGGFYIGANRKSIAGATAPTFTTWRTNGAGGWITVSGVTQVDITNYDDGAGTLTAMIGAHSVAPYPSRGQIPKRSLKFIQMSGRRPLPMMRRTGLTASSGLSSWLSR